MSQFIKRFSKNKAAVFGFGLVVFFILTSLLAPLLVSHSPYEVYEEALLVTPSWTDSGSSHHIFGTDDIGRDILSRILYGGRISVGVGFSVVFLALLFGVPLGLISGFFGGRIDTLIMRTVDIIMAVPSILLAIVVVAVLGPGLKNGVLAVSVVALPGFIRLVRASVIDEKSKLYTTAARSMGAHNSRILNLHILRNSGAPIIVQSCLGFSDAILNVSALGFLGLGAQPPTPEWGVMLADAKAYIEISPWSVTLPGICILLLVLGFNLMGDGLRDALDPKLKS